MARKILILGATSAIARGIAMRFASQGDKLFLASRDSIELERIAADLKIRYGTQIYTGKFDIENSNQHQTFFNHVLAQLNALDGIVFAIGYMGDSTEKTLHINFTAAVAIINLGAHYLESRKQGFIIGISSVAGDRGRQSNYTYGSAKGGFSLYLQGLRNRLSKHGIRVITIKPGFVDTAMTFGLPGLFLVANPKKVGATIADSLKHNADIVYVPWFWRYIMLIIKSIPEFLFKRMAL